MNIYDKLSEIFDLNEKVATESVSMSELFISNESITDENIDNEIKIAMESYIESEATLIGTASMFNQYIFLESVSDIDSLLFTNLDSSNIAYEAKDDNDGVAKANNGFMAKLKKLWELLVNNIVSMFKLMNLQSLKMLKLGKMAKKYHEAITKRQEELKDTTVEIPYVTSRELYTKVISGLFTFPTNVVTGLWTEIEKELLQNSDPDRLAKVLQSSDVEINRISKEFDKRIVELDHKLTEIKSELKTDNIFALRGPGLTVIPQVLNFLDYIQKEFNKTKILSDSKRDSKSLNKLTKMLKVEFNNKRNDKGIKFTSMAESNLSTIIKKINEVKKHMNNFEKYRLTFIENVFLGVRDVVKMKATSENDDK